VYTCNPIEYPCQVDLAPRQGDLAQASIYVLGFLYLVPVTNHMTFGGQDAG